MRKWILALAVVAVATVEVSAQPPRGGGRPSFERLLAAFDADGDGKLSKDEVPARVWARLQNADADGDGVVTADEFNSYRPSGA